MKLDFTRLCDIMSTATELTRFFDLTEYLLSLTQPTLGNKPLTFRSKFVNVTAEVGYFIKAENRATLPRDTRFSLGHIPMLLKLICILPFNVSPVKLNTGGAL